MTDKINLTGEALKKAIDDSETCPYKPTEICDGAEVSSDEFCGGCGVYKKYHKNKEEAEDDQPTCANESCDSTDIDDADVLCPECEAAQVEHLTDMEAEDMMVRKK